MMRENWQNEIRDTIPFSRVILSVLVLVVLSILGSRFFVSYTDLDAPVIEDGEISLAAWELSEKPIVLSGDWEFYWKQYLGADELPPSGEPEHAEIQTMWKNLVDKDGKPMGANWGYATYRATFSNLPPGSYAISLPMIAAPSRIWVNRELQSQTGDLGKTAEEERAIWKGHYFGFDVETSTVEILIEVSDHIHGGGRIVEPPVFGTVETVNDFQTLYMARDLIIQGIATVLFIFGLVLFIFRRRDRASLYFSVFCFLFGSTLSFLGINISEIVIPGADFWTKLNLYYIAQVGSFAAFVLYVSALYPNETNKWLNIAIYLTCATALGYATIGLWHKPAPIHLPFYSMFLQSMIAALAYTVFVAGRAALNRREGALIFLIGLSILVWFVGAEILILSGQIPQLPALGFGLGMMSLGFLVFLIAQVITLAQRWTHTLQVSERMTADLSRLIEVSSAISSEINLETLLTRIITVATQFIDADRSTLFLYDPETDELWSLVAEGIENREIRFPATEGIAGACFQSGDIINVDDAYNDLRFNRGFDELNNYRTRSILTMPVETKTGKRIGVMQVLNKRHGKFSALDQERLHAFAAQVAISIENAELFGEAVEARNYNDSILSSMSNGVITIDANGKIETLNDAAAAILMLPRDASLELVASDILEERNSWLHTEILLVQASGEPSIILDTDITIQDNQNRSVNISIVPLGTETGAGVLVLLEDISSEKRLKGTMTQIMPKEVAEQILAKGEETLSGTTLPASILFADLQNFTGISESLGPRETVALLNNLFGELTEVIFEHDGILDKFIGDSMMAVYGAPLEGPQDADNAVSTAIEMMRKLVRLNAERDDLNKPSLALSIGIASGEVVAGTVGSEKRVEYTVIGDSVNLAARLESITHYYGADIIVSEETLRACNSKPLQRRLDLLRVKGKTRPVEVFEVLEHHTGPTFPEMQQMLEYYDVGLNEYRERNWTKAASYFRNALKLHSGDRPSQVYLERCLQFEKTPPPKDWDGIWVMTTK